MAASLALVVGGVLIALATVGLPGRSENVSEGVEAALRRAMRARVVPQDLIVVYDDLHALHGGTMIELAGDGRATRIDRARGSRPKTTTRRVARAALAELIAELVRIEAWEQKTRERAPVPDESRAELRVSLAGTSGGFWEWYNDLGRNRRLALVKERLDRLVPIESR